MQTTPILTIQAAERLLNALEDYLDKSEGQLALVVDRGGIVLGSGASGGRGGGRGDLDRGGFRAQLGPSELDALPLDLVFELDETIIVHDLDDFLDFLEVHAAVTL